MTGALDAILQQADRTGGPIAVCERAGAVEPKCGFGVGEILKFRIMSAAT